MLYRGSGFRRIFTVTALFLLSVGLVHCTSDSSDSPNNKQATEAQQHRRALENVPELADAMGQLQYYTHKYALAVEAENHELAAFYFHEVRAAVDGIKQNIPGYEGYDIDRFMKLFLDPTIEPVETALAQRNWDEVRKKTIDMINACNSCHNATSHGFIQVKAGFDNNPYNQDFNSPE